jgi:putative SOS response-associated peptidase YedK
VATINHERMPVLLTSEEDFETWLRGSPDEAFALAREYPPDKVRIVQEGFKRKDLLAAQRTRALTKMLSAQDSSQEASITI